MADWPFDRLQPGWPGLENLPGGGVTPERAATFGTDIFGNLPTIGQFTKANQSEGKTPANIYNDAVTEGRITPLAGIVSGGVGPTAEGGSWIEQLLQRGAVLILGFIFVAIGLSMFARSGPVMAAVVAPVKQAKAKVDAGAQVAAANTA